jgi:hypothetical protein
MTNKWRKAREREWGGYRGWGGNASSSSDGGCGVGGVIWDWFHVLGERGRVMLDVVHAWEPNHDRRETNSQWAVICTSAMKLNKIYLAQGEHKCLDDGRCGITYWWVCALCPVSLSNSWRQLIALATFNIQTELPSHSYFSVTDLPDRTVGLVQLSHEVDPGNAVVYCTPEIRFGEPGRVTGPYEQHQSSRSCRCISIVVLIYCLGF